MLSSRLRQVVRCAKLLRRLSRRGIAQQLGGASYEIHPAIGVARLGNAKPHLEQPGQDPPVVVTDWMVAPSTQGGIPTDPSTGQEVEFFKNERGQIRRQAAKFTIYKDGIPLDLSDPANTDLEIKWKVYLANKKAVWWEFARLCGDLTLGEDNSYWAWNRKGVVFRRNQKWDPLTLQKFIINPGSREVTPSSPFASFSRFSPEFDPDKNSFPSDALAANGLTECDLRDPKERITSLGDMEMTTTGEANLFVRGGRGKVDGDASANIEGFAGADGLFDDTSDGPVECEITLGGETITLNAYVVCAQPNVAPELDNINTWDDVVFDMAVRYLGFGSGLGSNNFVENGKFVLGSNGFKPNITNDIAPLFKRMRDYQWVSNCAPMAAFASPQFDLYDDSLEGLAARQTWFGFLRQAINFDDDVDFNPVGIDSHQDAYIDADNNYPGMPMNAGSGSVHPNASLGVMSKFITMTPTQYYMLKQWSDGFTSTDATSNEIFNMEDRQQIGNCVGYPSSPGIEVCWNIRSQVIYHASDPYRLQTVPISALDEHGLSPWTLFRDETDPNLDDPDRGVGCEPGDLSKRMAVPWQADFTYCSAQSINFTDPAINKWQDYTQKWKLPLYYTYWWPAQSPLDIYVGPRTAEEASLELKVVDDSGELTQDPIANSGQNTEYMRGASGANDVLNLWSEFGFIRNMNTNADTKEMYPHFVETERGYAAIKNYLQPPEGTTVGDGSDGEPKQVPKVAKACPQQHVSRRKVGRSG